MIAYGSSETNPCGCPDKQPFCTTCHKRCDKKIDASCAVYHLLEPNAINHLTCLGLPNGVTVEQFMEAVDAAICAGIDVTPVIYTIDTPSIDLSGDGKIGTPLQADAVISPDSGNTLSIRPNGLYSPGGAGDDICPSVGTTFVTDSAQKNTVTQTAYDFLISGSAGCQKVSPPLGFAVSGTTRKSAFGSMEWYSSLSAANAAATTGETVILYTDAIAESIVAKAGVGYTGIGNNKILNFSASSVATTISNIVITGSLTVNGTASCHATNVSVFGTALITSTATWSGGRFYDNTTNLNITGSAKVHDIYSEKRVAVTESASLSHFVINYNGSPSTSGLDINVSTATICRVSNGTVKALSATTGFGATFVIVKFGGTVIIDSVISEATEAPGIYLQCGDQSNENTLIATNLTGKSIDGEGIKVVGNQDNELDPNNTYVVIDHCTGFSINNNGIFTINGNLKHCTGFSINSSGIFVGGSDKFTFNVNIIECIGESKNGYGIRLDKDAYVVGGTYISRLDSTAGNPIRLTENIALVPGSATRGYFIIGVKTIATNTSAYGISGVSGAIVRVSGCDFLNQNLLTNVPGIDPILTLRTVVTGEGLNTQTGTTAMSNRR